jgi:hypothetical protein
VDSASAGGGSLLLVGGVNQTIENCVIDGSGQGDAAIFSGHADGLTVQNTEVIAGNHGFNYRGDGSSSATNLTVDQCRIRDASGTDPRNLWLIDTENTTVTNSIIENSDDAGVGIESFDGVEYDIGTVQVTGCNIQSNRYRGCSPGVMGLSQTQRSMQSTTGGVIPPVPVETDPVLATVSLVITVRSTSTPSAVRPLEVRAHSEQVDVPL